MQQAASFISRSVGVFFPPFSYKSLLCPRISRCYMYIYYSEAVTKNMKVLIAVLFLAGVALAQELPTRPPKPSRPSPEERCKIIAQKCQSLNQASNLKICGSDKQMYTSKCQFMLARCENPSLKVDRNIRHCMGEPSQFSNMTKPTRGPRPTKPTLEDMCQKIKEEGCPDKMKEANVKICDAKGNVYTSRCAFMTAKCADPALRPSRGCRPPPTAEPTEPAL